MKKMEIVKFLTYFFSLHLKTSLMKYIVGIDFECSLHKSTWKNNFKMQKN